LEVNLFQPKLIEVIDIPSPLNKIVINLFKD